MTVAQAAPPSGAIATEVPPSHDRRRLLRRAWLAGAVPAITLYTWVLTTGRWSLLQRQALDDFFDAQARSFLDGRLDVPPEVVTFEGFIHNGTTHSYFGPFPALLRLPVLVMTRSLDGRLTTVSMLAAMMVLSIAAFRLTCTLRTVVRGEAPPGRWEPWTTAGLSVAVVLGPPLFLASGAIVYHEATAWGLAWSAAAFDAVARWQRQPTTGRLVVVAALVAAALLSRQSIALGPLVALVLSASALAARRWREADRHLRWQASIPVLAPVMLAALVPLAGSVAYNLANLGTPWGPPMSRQVYSFVSPERQEVLRANERFVGPEFLSTTTTQYFRPDAIDIRRDFPWIDFPRTGPTLMNESARFDKLDWSSSLPNSAPALVALALGGLLWTVRSRKRRAFEDRLSALWLGAAAGGASVLTFAYVANRYLNDLYPVVLVGGIVGFHVAHVMAPRLAPWRRRAALSGFGALIAIGAVVNLALGLVYQHERGPVVTESLRAEWIGWRLRLPGAPTPVRIAVSDPMPAVADGAVVVVGDCDGLYTAVWDRWRAVERGPGVGVYELDVDLDALPPGERVPLITFGHGDRSTVVGVVRLEDGSVRTDVLHPAFFEVDWRLGRPADLDGLVTISVNADHRDQPSNVTSGRTVLNGEGIASDSPVDIGRAPAREGVARTYPGTVRLRPSDTSICEWTVSSA